MNIYKYILIWTNMFIYKLRDKVSPRKSYAGIYLKIEFIFILKLNF